MCVIDSLGTLADRARDPHGCPNATGVAALYERTLREAVCAECTEPFHNWERVVEWGGLRFYEPWSPPPTNPAVASVFLHGECAAALADALLRDAARTERGAAYMGALTSEQRSSIKKQRKVVGRRLPGTNRRKK